MEMGREQSRRRLVLRGGGTGKGGQLQLCLLDLVLTSGSWGKGAPLHPSWTRGCTGLIPM